MANRRGSRYGRSRGRRRGRSRQKRSYFVSRGGVRL